MKQKLVYQNGKFVENTRLNANETRKSRKKFSKLAHDKKWNGMLCFFADLMNAIICIAVVIQVSKTLFAN